MVIVPVTARFELYAFEPQAALQQAETSLKVLEEGKAAAEVALETAHRELESAVTENQHLRVRVELMESAIEAEVRSSGSCFGSIGRNLITK